MLCLKLITNLNFLETLFMKSLITSQLLNPLLNSGTLRTKFLKNFFLISIASSMLATALPQFSQAQNYNPTFSSSYSQNYSVSPRKNWFLEITPLITYYKYDEVDENGNFFITIQGPLYGGKVKGYFNFNNGFYYQPLDIAVFGGKAAYKSAGTGKADGYPMVIVEAKNHLGTKITFNKDNALTLSAGVGYRFTGNLASGIETDAGYLAYDRYNHLIIVPFQLHYQYGEDTANFRFSLTSEASWIPIGWQDTRLPVNTIDGKPYFTGDANSEMEFEKFANNRKGLAVLPIINRQYTGYQLKQTVSFEFYRFLVAPYVSYISMPVSEHAPIDFQNIPSGQPKQGIVEPANTTFEAGVALGYSF